MHYNKRNIDAESIETINKRLSDQREARHGKTEETVITADTVECNFDEPYCQTIREMLRRPKGLWNGTKGEINVTQHAINMIPGSRPFKLVSYRAGPKTGELEESVIDKQQKAGFIEPSTFKWSAPVLFVPKNDGRLPFCIDDRGVNTMTANDLYVIPRMDEWIYLCGEENVFRMFDAYSGYWAVALREGDLSKTVFALHPGQFQYVRMLFGLTNVPATIQRALDTVLPRNEWKTCFIYIDDIFIFSNTVEDHIRHIDEIWAALQEGSRWGWRIASSSAMQFSTLDTYSDQDDLNLTTSLYSVPLQRETTTFEDRPSFFSRNWEYVPSFHSHLYEARASTQPNVQEWQAAPARARRRTRLQLPGHYLCGLLATGAGITTTGLILLHSYWCLRLRNWLHVIPTHLDVKIKSLEFWCCTLNDAEPSYSALERGFLAVVGLLKDLSPYLMHDKLLVPSDQHSLHWVFTISDPSGRLTQLQLRLAEIGFSIAYMKRTENRHAMRNLGAYLEARPSIAKETTTFLFSFWKATILAIPTAIPLISQKRSTSWYWTVTLSMSFSHFRRVRLNTLNFNQCRWPNWSRSSWQTVSARIYVGVLTTGRTWPSNWTKTSNMS